MKLHKLTYPINYLSAILFFLLVYSCQSEKESYCIKGELPTEEYNGEWIYLAPVKNASLKNIDSVRITGKEFTFKGNEESMKIIRMRILLRHKFQELLVVTEPGTIQVVIDSVSSAKGTPKNEDLQNWKEKKMDYDKQQQILLKQLRENSSANSNDLQNKQDSLKQDFQLYTIKLLKRQKGSVLGDFLYPLVEPVLTKEQRLSI